VTKEERKERGLRAAQLLDNADIRAAFALIKMELFTEWGDAKSEQERESLHSVSRACDRLVATLDRWRVDAELIRREETK
jgi:hypothetical protein